MTDSAVTDYHASFRRQGLDRLDTVEGRLEFAMTTRLVTPQLPDTGRVLDNDGGQWGRWRRIAVALRPFCRMGSRPSHLVGGYTRGGCGHTHHGCIQKS
ncbi:hypothetical protein [Actinoplanes rectilineatus]|uniref:hypothetical protein n=1 Tax=Actinoplanes rectilineatus TaxID=113571 RepID=UPI0005F2EA8B|nr:hypothetical protein [Actinoplanes rectilineatus]